jgi:acetate kinase
MKILVVNCGSSSLKCLLINMEDESILAKGIVEEIGLKAKYSFNNKKEKDLEITNHETALNKIIEDIIQQKIVNDLSEIDAIGHRIVHGGEFFKDSVLIDDNVVRVIKDCFDLAPLHNPANLIGINACKKELPNKPMVGVFDTAFHQTMPIEAFIYPIPFEYYEKYHLRKYGFHGTSHKFVAQRASELLGKKLGELNIITCHLGNGASITAIEKGKSVNTSMGFTPLAGVMMGTRSGDIDPSIIPFLMKKNNLTVDEVEDILNKKSGLLGLSGISNDCREIKLESINGNERARIALNKFAYRIKEYIGSFTAIMNGLDAIVFTAGIGENFVEIRELICKDLEHLGIELDKEKNNIIGKETIISKKDSRVRILVIPTNEELMIARETKKIILQKFL